MNKYIKGTLNFLLQILVSTVLVVCINIGMNGMYLIGIPQIGNVEKVTISYPEATDGMKEISDEEHLELAVKLSGFLRYSLFQEADVDKSPLITITYYTCDGRTVSVSANRETVWWKGKAHALKDDEIFINMTEGIFFLEDLVK